MDIGGLRKLINETFRELRIDEFVLLGKGKAGVICLVNNEIVFKIPMQKEGEIARWQALTRIMKVSNLVGVRNARRGRIVVRRMMMMTTMTTTMMMMMTVCPLIR
jgi:hypothetical protein